MCIILKQITIFAKQIQQQNPRLKIFVLSDPLRSPNIELIAAKLPKNCYLIARTFGQSDEISNLKNRHRIYVSESASVAYKNSILGIHIPSKTKNRLNYKNVKLQKTGSAHNLREVIRANQLGVNYCLISPIFTSQSPSAKKNGKNFSIGIIKLALLTKLFPKTNFVALGGINRKNYKRLSCLNLKAIAGVSFG
jgi:thiamine-phosphate pyrophosphorylase